MNIRDDIGVKLADTGRELRIVVGVDTDITSVALSAKLRHAGISVKAVESLIVDGGRLLVDDRLDALPRVKRVIGNLKVMHEIDLEASMPQLCAVDGNLILLRDAIADRISEVSGRVGLDECSSMKGLIHVGDLNARVRAAIPNLKTARGFASLGANEAPELLLVGDIANLVDARQAPKLIAAGNGAEWYFIGNGAWSAASGYNGKPVGKNIAQAMIDRYRAVEALLPIAVAAIVGLDEADDDRCLYNLGPNL